MTCTYPPGLRQLGEVSRMLTILSTQAKDWTRIRIVDVYNGEILQELRSIGVTTGV